eukprot:g54579.t1
MLDYYTTGSSESRACVSPGVPALFGSVYGEAPPGKAQPTMGPDEAKQATGTVRNLLQGTIRASEQLVLIHDTFFQWRMKMIELISLGAAEKGQILTTCLRT